MCPRLWLEININKKCILLSWLELNGTKKETRIVAYTAILFIRHKHKKNVFTNLTTKKLKWLEIRKRKLKLYGDFLVIASKLTWQGNANFKSSYIFLPRNQSTKIFVWSIINMCRKNFLLNLLLLFFSTTGFSVFLTHANEKVQRSVFV